MPVREEGLSQTVPGSPPAAFHPKDGSPSAPAPSPVVEKTAPKPTPSVRTERSKPRGASPVWVTRSLVREVQRRLKRQGYPIGKVDGSLGSRTTQSIRRFQRDVSLHPTGRIDGRLMASLGMDADNRWPKKSVARPQRVRKPRVAKRWRPTKAHVKEVQRRLALIGYQPGSADGVYGHRTAWAVKRFQRHVGLKPTGLIDQRLLRHLSIEP